MANEINPIVRPEPRRLMPSLETSKRGMSVQQSFLEVIAKNIANAETTRLPEGGAYRREVASALIDPSTGQVTAEISADPRPGRAVYDPGHPDANAEGFVEYPNVNVESEVVDLMVIRRLYEANAAVFQAAKNMLKRALEI